MTIKSKDSELIYRGCVLCQAIEDFLEVLYEYSDCANLVGDASVKRLILMKENWLESLGKFYRDENKND